MSKGEARIIQLFKQDNIRFEREKCFQNLRRGRLRFDFYLPRKHVLVEYDGEQHFHFVDKFYKQQTDFLKAKERDRLKNSYSLARGIPLYRIPYWKLSSLNTSEDIFKDEYLVKTRWHNDRLVVPKR